MKLLPELTRSCRKTPEWMKQSINSGDDIAGIVHAIGPNVYEFKPGDRVAAFHEMRTPGGSFAEYAVAWQHTTSHIPENLSFEGIHAPLSLQVKGTRQPLRQSFMTKH